MANYRTFPQNKLKEHTKNAICDECGFKYKKFDLRKKWNGLLVCRKCWEPQHPSELYNYRSHEGSGDDGVYRSDDTGTTPTGTTDISGNPIPPPLTITTTSLASLYIGDSVSYQLEFTGSTPDQVTWSISAGSLPSGFTLDANTGIISGTGASAATSNFTVLLTADDGRTDTQALSIEVLYLYGVPLTWTTGLKSSQTNGISYYGGAYQTGEGALLTIGGNQVPFAHGYNSSKWYDIDTNTWSTSGITHLQTNPTGYNYMQGICNQVDGCYYTLQSAGGNTMNVKKYDPSIDTWSTEDTFTTGGGYLDRYALADTSYGGIFDWMLFGGFGNSGGGITAKAYGYSSATGNITAVSDMPAARYQNNAAGLRDGSVILCGMDSTTKTAWRYYPATDTYDVIDDMPIPLYNANIATSMDDGKAYIGGGKSTGGSNTLSTIVYDPDTALWSMGTSLPSPYYPGADGGWNGSCRISDGRLFVMEGNSHASVVNYSFMQAT